MYYNLLMLLSFIEVLIVIVPLLLSVAFMTIAERKAMGSMQRRLGPNRVGYYGLLQPFADALKLFVKESVIPAHSNKALFLFAPIISLITSLLAWGVIPFGAGLTLSDLSLGILYLLAVGSLGVYGVIFAGWSANSKYAFLGGLRSTAQMVSYEVVMGLIILTVVLLVGSLNLTNIIQAQINVWYIIPLLPLSLMFLISVIAETNRAPFDLPEAESELVAGFFTEHSSVPFVMFFLAEYASIILMSTFVAMLFLGGYLVPFVSFENPTFFSFEGLALGLKTCLILFIYIWVRASFPRLRYDQLMSFTWTGMLPLTLGFIILVPCILMAFEIA
ncbi:NADH-quinone oxidoreductase subunit NuoH [Nesterenkonia halophila]|jgi:NADH-ubiquinone oxidoreductase chain 1